MLAFHAACKALLWSDDLGLFWDLQRYKAFLRRWNIWNVREDEQMAWAYFFYSRNGNVLQEEVEAEELEQWFPSCGGGWIASIASKTGWLEFLF